MNNNSSKKFWNNEVKRKIARGLLAALALVVLSGTASPQNNQLIFSAGNPDGKLGALSRPTSPGNLETETADDFVLKQTTFITSALITGLISPAAPLANIANVEVELYHVFPQDSADPPSGNVPSRVNSPADVEISSATRDASQRTLGFSPGLLNANFSVPNSVVNGINKKPNFNTEGEGPQVGNAVQIGMVFTPPILLPPGRYFFRPEVQVTGANFLYLSAPRPIVPPGTPFPGDLQAWIRNSDLAPDWLRIGTDIIGGITPPTFNMTFNLSGTPIPNAGTPGQAACIGTTSSALTEQFGSIRLAAIKLGFFSVKDREDVVALQDAVSVFCEP